MLLQAVQFGGTYLALQHGVPAGLVALFAGSSPLLVAPAGSVLFGERLRPRQWAGSVIGLTGVVFAVAEELHGTVRLSGLALVVLGAAGLTGGTLIQRRHGARVDPRCASAIQLATATLVTAPVAAATQGVRLPLNVATLAPFAWLAIGLSIFAVLLYFWLLRWEKGGEATSFLHLVPSVTAIASVPVLGQALSVGAVAGLVVALIGVRMVSPRPAPEPLRRTRRGSIRARSADDHSSGGTARSFARSATMSISKILSPRVTNATTAAGSS